MTERRDFGPKPKLCWLPVNRLTVDMRYQRTLESTRSVKLIDRMVAEFRWQRFGAVLAAPAAVGNYALIDGQHRVEVLKRLGEPECPAILLEAITLAEQASAFLAANRDRVTVNQFAIHHAAVQSGDPVAVAINAICVASDVVIPRCPIQAANMKPNQTMALGAIKKLSQMPDGERTLKVLRAAFPDDAGALRAHIIAGVAQVIKDQPAIDDAALSAAIGRTGLRRFEMSIFGHGGATGRSAIIAELVESLLPRRVRQAGPTKPALPDGLEAIKARLDAEEAARPKVQVKPAPAPAAKPQKGRDMTSALFGDPVRR